MDLSMSYEIPSCAVRRLCKRTAGYAQGFLPLATWWRFERKNALASESTVVRVRRRAIGRLWDDVDQEPVLSRLVPHRLRGT